MSISEIKPVAKAVAIGSAIGGIGGMCVAGPAGAAAGANFIGSLFGKLAMYNKGEDAVAHFANHAGRRFEAIAQNTQETINASIKDFVSGLKKTAELYASISLFGHAASFGIYLSHYSAISSREMCVYDKDFMTCNAMRGASLACALMTAVSAFMIYKDVMKIKKEGLFNDPTNQPNAIPRTARRTRTAAAA